MEYDRLMMQLSAAMLENVHQNCVALQTSPPKDRDHSSNFAVNCCPRCFPAAGKTVNGQQYSFANIGAFVVQLE